MMSKGFSLSVNLNKIALLRNSRSGNFPDVTEFGRICLDAGAHGITVHPRPDCRHIRPSDVEALSELVQQYPGREFNIEGNPFAPANAQYPGLEQLVATVRAHQVTLVPDTHEQLTSDHGFDLRVSARQLQPIIDKYQQLGVRVSLFMDPDAMQIRLAKQIQANRIELYTGPFAEAYKNDSKEGATVFNQYEQAAQIAIAEELGINAGHDLNLQNLTLFRQLSGLQEVSIGHALTVEALHFGYRNTIAEYLKLCAPTLS